jgi:hypothetical protein
LDLALVSCRRLPEPDPDAEPLLQALAGAGIETEVLAWDDPDVDWSRPRLSVLRSTWNYPHSLEAFLDWAEKTSSVSGLWNPLHVVRWSAHKGYLLELEESGVPITPTALLRRGSRTTLEQVRRERGWTETVVKPAVSAASFKTLRVGPESSEVGETHLRELLRDRDVLVQRYLPSVESYGERALIWIDGELTHAVRKSPRFDGEDESVSTDSVQISDAEAALARQALRVVRGPLLYARVDLAPGPDGSPVLMELELVEPSLFFPQNPGALERFVSGIRGRLKS